MTVKEIQNNITLRLESIDHQMKSYDQKNYQFLLGGMRELESLKDFIIKIERADYLKENP